MNTFCGNDCCSACPQLEGCGGCEKTDGHPCGGSCVAAECVKAHGVQAYKALKARIIDRINSLGIEGLRVDDLNLLNGAYVNLAYPLETGGTVQFLRDNDCYFANQIEIADSDRCFGVVANEKMLIVAQYGCMGADAKLLAYLAL